MESENKYQVWTRSEFPAFKDIFETVILKFIWVETAFLDDFDIAETVTLVKSFSVGHRMTRQLLYDILSQFTRVSRCSPSDIIHNSEKCSKLCLMYNECFESWKNYDQIGMQLDVTIKRENKNVKMTSTEKGDEVNETQLPANITSYTNPFQCYLNLSSVVHTSSAMTDSNLNDNQDVKLNMGGAAETRQDHSKRYPKHVNEPGPSEQEVSDPLTSEGLQNKLSEKENGTTDVNDNNDSTSDVLHISETLQQELTRGPPPGDDNLRTPLSNKISLDGGNRKILSDFIYQEQPFKSVWGSGDDKTQSGKRTVEDLLLPQDHIKMNCSEKSLNAPGFSTILDEISMDISDSFDEWFKESFDDLPPQLIIPNTLTDTSSTQPSGSTLQPDNHHVRSSTPVTEDAHPEGDMVKPTGELKSLWPELPSLGQAARRRLWEDTDIGVRPLRDGQTVGADSPGTRRSNSDSNMKKCGIGELLDKGSLSDLPLPSVPAPRRIEQDKVIENGNRRPQLKFDPQIQFRQPMPTTQPTTFIPFSTSIQGITPLTPSAAKETVGQLRMPSTSNISSAVHVPGQTQPTHLQHCQHHPQATFTQNMSSTQKQQRLESANWAQTAVNGFLPQSQFAHPIALTSNYSHPLGPLYTGYQLWPQRHQNSAPNTFAEAAVSANHRFVPNVAAPGAPLLQAPAWPKPAHATQDVIGNKPPVWGVGPRDSLVTKTQLQLNAERAAHQRAIQQQMLQPPPGIQLSGGAHLHPSLPSHQAPHQHQQPYAYHPSANAGQPGFDLFLGHEDQQRPWAPWEQFLGSERNGRGADGLGSAFKPYYTEHQPLSAQQESHRQQQLKQIQERQKHSKQEQFLMDQQPFADVLPPWRRERQPGPISKPNDRNSMNAVGVNNILSEEIPFRHAIARASEQLLGQDGPGMFSGPEAVRMPCDEPWKTEGQSNGVDSLGSKCLPISKSDNFIPGASLNKTEWPLPSKLPSTSSKNNPTFDAWRLQQQKVQQKENQEKQNHRQQQGYQQLHQLQQQLVQLQKLQQIEELKRHEQLRRQKQQHEQQQLQRQHLQRQQQQQLLQQGFGQWPSLPPFGSGPVNKSDQANFCFPGASNFSVTQQADYRAMVQAFTPQASLQQRQPQVRQAVPSMAEVAWASLGVLPPPPPSGPRPHLASAAAGSYRQPTSGGLIGWGNKN